MHTLSGDFFVDPIGSGYDIIFSSSNPGGNVSALIPKIAAALNDGGLFITKQPFEEVITPEVIEEVYDLPVTIERFCGRQVVVPLSEP